SAVGLGYRLAESIQDVNCAALITDGNVLPKRVQCRSQDALRHYLLPARRQVRSKPVQGVAPFDNHKRGAIVGAATGRYGARQLTLRLQLATGAEQVKPVLLIPDE